MDINDAQPGDIYADEGGKLWRITDVIKEPTIEAEEVEGHLDDPNAPKMPVQAGQGIVVPSAFMPMAARIVKVKRRAFTGADVWKGWRRIWRREPATTDAT